MRKLHAIASSTLPPNATPMITASDGMCISSSFAKAVCPRRAVARCVLMSLSSSPLISAPAQKRIIQIRRQLHLGQTVRYFDLDTGQMRLARVVEMKDKEILVQDQAALRHWRLAYAAVEPPTPGQTDTAETAAATAPPVQPATSRREDFQRGQKVAFEDRHLRTQVGVTTRINQRTASIDTGDGLPWKVSFGLLPHVVDV